MNVVRGKIQSEIFQCQFGIGGKNFTWQWISR